jgi:hypothetical protein
LAAVSVRAISGRAAGHQDSPSHRDRCQCCRIPGFQSHRRRPLPANPPVRRSRR